MPTECSAERFDFGVVEGRVVEAGHFLRTNDPATDCWYSHDIPAIAARRSLSRAAPFFVDADDAPNPGSWPSGGLTVVSFPNNHLVYALIWFNLALPLAVAGVQHRVRHKH